MTGITPSEQRVLDQLAAGRTNIEIAAHLGITEQTVKFHISAVLRKTGLRNRVELAVARVRAELTGEPLRLLDEPPPARRISRCTRCEEDRAGDDGLCGFCREEVAA